MSIGTITTKRRSGDDASAPLRADAVSMPGDGAYTAGGTAEADVVSALEDALGLELTIVDITGFDTTGRYALHWDSDAMALKIIDLDPTPPAEAANGDYSGSTFLATVLSK